MLKNLKKINQKSKTAFMQRIHSKNPPRFHMYNLAELDVRSAPCQIPKLDVFAIIAFNSYSFTSLTIFTKSSTSDAWQRSEFIFAKCCA